MPAGGSRALRGLIGEAGSCDSRQKILGGADGTGLAGHSCSAGRCSLRLGGAASSLSKVSYRVMARRPASGIQRRVAARPSSRWPGPCSHWPQLWPRRADFLNDALELISGQQLIPPQPK
jgi:hypothetical protein